jgi:hypothetical protein
VKLAPEAVDYTVEKIVDNTKDAGRCLECSLVFHEVGHLLVEGNTTHCVALGADKAFNVGLILNPRVRTCQSLPQIAYGTAVKVAQSSID